MKFCKNSQSEITDIIKMNSTSARRVRGEPDLEEILLRLSGNMKLSFLSWDTDC